MMINSFKQKPQMQLIQIKRSIKVIFYLPLFDLNASPLLIPYSLNILCQTDMYFAGLNLNEKITNSLPPELRSF